MSAQSNIINDMSSTTRVPIRILTELAKQETLCIGSAIRDAVENKESQIVLNIGIGFLSVDIGTKQCKFVPNKELKKAIRQSIDDKVDPLEQSLEEEIVTRLLKIYAEVLEDEQQ